MCHMRRCLCSERRDVGLPQMEDSNRVCEECEVSLATAPPGRNSLVLRTSPQEYPHMPHPQVTMTQQQEQALCDSDRNLNSHPLTD